jgi:hypothetical protein
MKFQLDIVAFKRIVLNLECKVRENTISVHV